MNEPTNEPLHITAVIPENYIGWRLDRTLAEMFSDYSRSNIKNWILSGKIKLDQKTVRPRETVSGGEHIEIYIEEEQQVQWQAEAIPINIVFEDEDLIIINKPSGLVVHPGAGNSSGTLVNALLHHDPDLVNLPRAGIVHRLDKDTTGIMVVARSLRAHTSLVQQLQSRSLKREYQAIVNGTVVAGGTIDAAIGRHPTQRTRMAIVEGGKPAVTHYRVFRRFADHTHLYLQLESGRTHQIRVHMTHTGHSLIGDPVYGGRLKLPRQCSQQLAEQLQNFKRQALHAHRLTLIHPYSDESMSWSTPLPADMLSLLEALAE